jgi:hypothetical protein
MAPVADISVPPYWVADGAARTVSWLGVEMVSVAAVPGAEPPVPPPELPAVLPADCAVFPVVFAVLPDVFPAALPDGDAVGGADGANGIALSCAAPAGAVA